MESYVVEVTTISLQLILLLSAPAVLVALVVGLFISLIQATTQVQEQTLTFVPKLVAVVLVLALSGEWTMRQLKDFTTEVLTNFPKHIKTGN